MFHEVASSGQAVEENQNLGKTDSLIHQHFGREPKPRKKINSFVSILIENQKVGRTDSLIQQHFQIEPKFMKNRLTPSSSF